MGQDHVQLNTLVKNGDFDVCLAKYFQSRPIEDFNLFRLLFCNNFGVWVPVLADISLFSLLQMLISYFSKKSFRVNFDYLLNPVKVLSF